MAKFKQRLPWSSVAATIEREVPRLVIVRCQVSAKTRVCKRQPAGRVIQTWQRLSDSLAAVEARQVRHQNRTGLPRDEHAEQPRPAKFISFSTKLLVF